MAKKIVWIIVVIALWILAFSVDNIRVSHNEKPWFCFPFETENGTGYYYGLGYKAYVITQKNTNGKYVVKKSVLGIWFSDLKGATHVR